MRALMYLTKRSLMNNLKKAVHKPSTLIALTRDQLLTEIWGYDFDGETRTVDVHIRTLRQKLGTKGEIIQTVRGVGYRVGGVA